MADIGLLVAFGGGLISFASPCVLPIVPGFLTLITGLDITSEEARRGRTRAILRDTGLFVLGFSVVFVLLGVTATSVGRALFRNQTLLGRVSGALVLAMALYLLGSLVVRSPRLYQERRFHPRLSKLGPYAAPVGGVAFGFGWTPCIGPVLTSVLAIAATAERVGEGALLLAVYSLGLAVPFFVTALAFNRLAGAFGWVRRHLQGITVAAGLSMAVFGVLLIFDQLTWVTSRFQALLQAAGLEELIFLG